MKESIDSLPKWRSVFWSGGTESVWTRLSVIRDLPLNSTPTRRGLLQDTPRSNTGGQRSIYERPADSNQNCWRGLRRRSQLPSTESKKSISLKFRLSKGCTFSLCP